MPAFIAPHEILARYITSSRWFRSNDQTVKPDAFIPQDDLELSVNRHINLDEEGIWKIGNIIASSIPRTLHGRADIETSAVNSCSLNVLPQPVSNNNNHAVIVGWPSGKDAKKMCALKIARVAKFVPKPEV
jgi:hypothetical protein